MSFIELYFKISGGLILNLQNGECVQRRPKPVYPFAQTGQYRRLNPRGSMCSCPLNCDTEGKGDCMGPSCTFDIQTGHFVRFDETHLKYSLVHTCS